MKRLTTNCPDNNLDAALNMFYIKDFETWVRGGGDGPDYPDIRLYDFIRKAAKILLPDLDFPTDDDGVDCAMGELLLDGPDEPTGLLALLYTAAWSYAELRGRLMQYEDTGLTPGEVKSMQGEHFSGLEMAKLHSALMELKKYQEADKDGRLVVLPCKVGQRVFALLDTDKHISECEVKQIGVGNKIGFIGLEPIGARGREYGVALNGFGKTVFLTREEAEKALEAMKNE